MSSGWAVELFHQAEFLPHREHRNRGNKVWLTHTNGRQLSAIWRFPRGPTPFPLTGSDCIWQGRPHDHP